jgi:hypothetical protein
MTYEDLNVLGWGDETEMVQVYGSLDSAFERYRHLRASGELETNCGAFWYFDGPDHLRSFEAWFETTDFDVPTTMEEQVALDVAFERAREKWLEENK